MAEAEHSYYVKAGSKKVKKLDEPTRIEAAAERGDVVIATNEAEEAEMRQASKDAQRMGRMKEAKTVIDMPSVRKSHRKETAKATDEAVIKEMRRQIAEGKGKAGQPVKIEKVEKTELVKRPAEVERKKVGFFAKLFGAK